MPKNTYNIFPSLSSSSAIHSAVTACGEHERCCSSACNPAFCCLIGLLRISRINGWPVGVPEEDFAQGPFTGGRRLQTCFWNLESIVTCLSWMLSSTQITFCRYCHYTVYSVQYMTDMTLNCLYN